MPSGLGVQLSLASNPRQPDPRGILGPNLVGMFDPGIPSTLAQTVFAGLGGAMSDGDPVGLWKDLSGYNNHWRQTQVSAPDYRPIWKAAAMNGRPTVRMSGAQFMTMLDSASYKTPIVWCMMAVSSTTGATTIIGYPYAAGHTFPFFDWLLWSGSPTVIETRQQTVTADVTVANTSTPSIISHGTASGAIYQNNVFMGTGVAGATLSYPNATGLRIGANGGPGEFMIGDFGPILLATAEPTPGQQFSLFQWVAYRAGFNFTSKADDPA